TPLFAPVSAVQPAMATRMPRTGNMVRKFMGALVSSGSVGFDGAWSKGLASPRQPEMAGFSGVRRAMECGFRTCGMRSPQPAADRAGRRCSAIRARSTVARGLMDAAAMTSAHARGRPWLAMAVLAVLALGATVFVAHRALAEASDIVVRGEADV